MFTTDSNIWFSVLNTKRISNKFGLVSFSDQIVFNFRAVSLIDHATLSYHATLGKFKKKRVLGWWSYSTIFLRNKTDLI
jgi:hypothetical protein